MSLSAGRRNEQQQKFHRQATILRKNLITFDNTLHQNIHFHHQPEDWPRMLGRLNAAWNQAANLNNGIEHVLEHFVYVPRKCPANPQDVPFFLSTRLAESNAIPESTTTTSSDTSGAKKRKNRKPNQKKRKGNTKKRKRNEQYNDNSDDDSDSDSDHDDDNKDEGDEDNEKQDNKYTVVEDPSKILRLYEEQSTKMANSFEESMIRY